MFRVIVDKSDEDALEQFTVNFNRISTQYQNNNAIHLFQPEHEDDILSLSAKLNHLNIHHTIMEGSL